MHSNLLEALKVAREYVAHQASFAPTTNERLGRVLKARKDLTLIDAAIERATEHAA